MRRTNFVDMSADIDIPAKCFTSEVDILRDKFYLNSGFIGAETIVSMEAKIPDFVDRWTIICGNNLLFDPIKSSQTKLDGIWDVDRFNSRMRVRLWHDSATQKRTAQFSIQFKTFSKD